MRTKSLRQVITALADLANAKRSGGRRFETNNRERGINMQELNLKTFEEKTNGEENRGSFTPYLRSL